MKNSDCPAAETLFRAKLKDTRKWIYWNMYGELCGVSGKRTRLSVPTKSGEAFYHYIYQIKQLIDSATIGRFTGKCIGKEKLFEGDVVEWSEDPDDKFGYPTTVYYNSEVFWDNNNHCWSFKTKLTNNDFIETFDSWNWDYTSIVGDVYDNPDLLD